MNPKYLILQDRFENKKEVKFVGDMTILELALQEKIEIGNSCGGMGSCGTCQVLIVEGADCLEPRNEIEAEMAQDRGFLSNERLACQTLACDKLKVKIP